MIENNVPANVRELATLLASPRPMRRGSMSERSMKCGHKECRCQHDPKARHGPYYSLTRMEKGKTQSRYLNSDQAVLARQQIDAGQAFRARIEAYWEACEEWADAQLLKSEAAPSEGTKKGASSSPLKPK
jgi:hypothetical protein